jgi:hypothetical protein
VSLFEISTRVTLRNKILWLGLFLIPIAWQLWAPPQTGLADNGDFAKVIGRFALTPVDPGPQPTFHFFNKLWQYEPKALWVSPYWGIEVWLTQLAVWLGQTNPFDIRWLGLIHVAIFAAALWLMIQKRIAPNLFALIAFTDAAYVTYFHSFYFDAASIIFLVLLIAAWYADQPVLLALAAVGFSLAKAPHAPLAILLALILLAERKRRYLPAALALFAGGAYMLSQTKDEYKATAYYNLAFFKLGLMDPQSLDALSIRPEDRHLVGTHAFMPDSPAQQPGWLNAFYPAGGYGNALRYYATHPAITAKVLWNDLATEAPQIRAINLGNYERSTGKRYCTLSTTFGWYSSAKSWLFQAAPWHIFLLFPLAIWRIGNRPLLYAILAIGGYEFAVASLADACETHRHLLLFHLAYDLLIWLAIMKAWNQYPGARN